jgi:DNA-binding NarL/FixJ family response regulator
MAEELRSPDRLRVLVVDDHEVVHWGFRLMLAQQPWVERCLSATSGKEAVALVSRYRPHVALVDLFIGEESGAEVCERLRAAEPTTRVLLFSGAGEISPHAARAAGASGFAYKDWPARKIASAVRMVGLGKTVFDHQDRPVAMGLSDRERDVLTLMASGDRKSVV